MKTILYFEEYPCRLTKELESRDDIQIVYLYFSSCVSRYRDKVMDDAIRKPNSYIFHNNFDFDTEINNFKRWLDHKGLKPEYFLCDSEYHIGKSNEIASALGLEALTMEQVSWVRDKVEMKKKFNEIGMDTVEFAPIENKEDIRKFFLDHGEKEIVFKPRDGLNSYNVFRINKLEDIDNLDIEIKPNKYMVETFCYDQEWSIESLVQDGKVLDSYLTYIPNATIWASINNGLNCHMTVPNHPEYFKFSCKEFIQQIVDGMNLRNGAMTIEVFIDKDGNIKPSELGWRLPGCQATMNHSLSYGFNMYQALIDIALKNPVKLEYQTPILSVGDLYLPNKEGIITDITPLNSLLEYWGVVDAELDVNVGDYRKKRRRGNDASGWVQVIGRNEGETYDLMKYIYDNFKIEVESVEKGNVKELKKNN